jgi:drug/metabolite transporter (DMT)-like permease
MLPHVLLLAAVVLWGWTFVFTKLLLTELGPVEIFAVRLILGVPVIAGVLVAKRVPLAFTRADISPLVLGGAVFTLHFFVQIAGLTTTTATNTGWMIAVSPLAMAILAFLFLGERLGRAGVAGIAIATIGVLLLVSRGRLTDLSWLRNTGDWLVLTSALTWAVFTVVTRNLVQRRHPLAVTLAVLLIAATFTAVLVVTSADLSRVRALSPHGIAAALYLGILGLALGQWFWQEGVARLGATRAGIYLYFEPLATLALAVPLLGEPFGPVAMLGGALVLAGVYVAQRGRP